MCFAIGLGLVVQKAMDSEVRFDDCADVISALLEGEFAHTKGEN